MNSPWLPRNYEVEDGILTGALVLCNDSWQVYESKDGKGNIIVINERFVDELANCNCREAVNWLPLPGMSERLFYYWSAGVVCYLDNYFDAQVDYYYEAVARAIREYKNSLPQYKLTDALYLESEEVCLPFASERKLLDDDIVLGRILTGGVNVSVCDIDKVLVYSDLDRDEIKKIIRLSGMKVEDDVTETEKTKTSMVANDKFKLTGRPGLEAFFNEHVVDIVNNQEEYERMGIGFPGGIILYGAPGCGKTYAVNKLVEHLGWPSFTIDSTSVGSPYIHQTGKLIAETFEKAIESAPSVVIIDEMEAFVPIRQSDASHQHNIEEVAEFLRMIPKAIENKVLVIAMTNHLDMIDPAVRRTGRFDHSIEVGMPSVEEVEALLGHLLSNRPCEADINTRLFAEKLAGRPLSDVDFVVREAARMAVKSGVGMITGDILEKSVEAFTPKFEKKKSNKIGFI